MPSLARFLAQLGVREAPLTLRAATNPSFLPEPFHGDPADRLLVATAHERGVPLLTRDRHVLAYAAETAR